MNALDPRSNVSVAASAGSGKTWLLTARIVRLLLDGCPPERILALTFTRKAAAEMGQRVRARLRELALATPPALDDALAAMGLVPDDVLRQRARGLFEALLFNPLPLRATTLHAFCQDLVSRFPLQAGVAPGFEVIEAEGELLEAAWQALLRRLQYAPQGDAARAAETLIALGESEFGLRHIIIGFLQRRGDWYAMIEGEADPLAFALAALRARLGVDGDEQAHAGVDAPAFVDSLKVLRDGLHKTGGSTWITLDALAPALDQSGAGRLATLIRALFKKSGEEKQLGFSREAQSRLRGDELAQLRATHAALVVELAAMRDLQRRLATCARTSASLALGVAALAELERECRARNALGFTDLEWLAWRLLTRDEAAAFVQFRLDSRIDHLLVDEFQDTSPTQWRLLLPLLREMSSGDAGRPRSAFIVGDAKQSIYGFRRANPALMSEAAKFLREHMEGCEDVLSDSRRSAPAIIAFVNRLFTDSPLRERIADFPLHGTHRRGAWGRVELAPRIEVEPAGAAVAQEVRNPLAQRRADAENTRALREGRQIAQRIRALVDSRPRIEEHGVERALDYGDVMILLRARTHAGALEQALTESGIAFVGSARATLLDTVEARDLTALLRFLDAPGRDLELAHALRSPLFSASDDDLVSLARAARAGAESWWPALRATAPASAALQRAAAALQEWLPLARQLPVHDLLDRIVCDGDVCTRYESALPGPAAMRVRGNLGAYVQLALQADSGRYPSLGAFLAWLERTQADADAGPDEAPPPAAGRQVRVLTIHAAKGLEAAAVFVAQCAGAGNPAQAGWLVDWPHQSERPELMVLAANKLERDAACAALIEQRQALELREEANLIYVAATRARHFLHFSGFAPARASRQPSPYDHVAQAFAALGIDADASGVRVYALGEPQRADPSPPASAQPEPDARLRLRIAVAGHTPLRASDAREGDAASARRGTAVHWLLQQLVGPAPPVDARLRPRLHALLGSDFSVRDFEEWLAEARAVLAAPALARFFDPRHRAWNEVPLRSGAVNGVPDRVVDDGHTLWIVDYKTAVTADSVALLERYRPQLQAYRDGVRALWPGRPVRAGLILTASAAWVELPA